MCIFIAVATLVWLVLAEQIRETANFKHGPGVRVVLEAPLPKIGGPIPFHLLKNTFYFSLLVLQGIYYYLKYVFFFFFFTRGLSKWKFLLQNTTVSHFFSQPMAVTPRISRPGCNERCGSSGCSFPPFVAHGFSVDVRFPGCSVFSCSSLVSLPVQRVTFEYFFALLGFLHFSRQPVKQVGLFAGVGSVRSRCASACLVCFGNIPRCRSGLEPFTG